MILQIEYKDGEGISEMLNSISDNLKDGSPVAMGQHAIKDVKIIGGD